MEKSRNELISWMNDLLQLNLTKVEQAGTGAALCQIMDSIYGMLVSNWRRCSPSQGQVQYKSGI